MKGEVEFFRKKFIGGFNRKDVVSYITKLANERNESRDGKEKAEADSRTLAAEVTSLRAELEIAKKEG